MELHLEAGVIKEKFVLIGIPLTLVSVGSSGTIKPNITGWWRGEERKKKTDWT